MLQGNIESTSFSLGFIRNFGTSAGRRPTQTGRADGVSGGPLGLEPGL